MTVNDCIGWRIGRLTLWWSGWAFWNSWSISRPKHGRAPGTGLFLGPVMIWWSA